MDQLDTIQPGRDYDGYVIDSVLGRGGNAVVYLVQHQPRGTWHALKVLRTLDGRRRLRIEQEAILRDDLRHRNIVPAFESVDVEGAPGLVMDFVEGPTLQEFLADDPPTDLVWRLHLFEGIVEGVRHAHAHNVVHRDLKPSNVLLQPDQHYNWLPRISDFGLAKAMSPEAGKYGGLTTFNTSLGSAGYAAPEQVRDASTVDSGADLYSLGCILYELVCGIGPFAGRSTFDTLQAQHAGDYRPPHELAPGLPPALYQLIVTLIAADPADRPHSCDQLLADLHDILEPIDRPPPEDAPPSLPSFDAGIDLIASALWIPALLCIFPAAALVFGTFIVFLF